MSYIDREKAIENVSQIRIEVQSERAVGKTIFIEALHTYRDAVLKTLNKAPTADVVEVRHGEWKYHECVSSYDGCISGYACSVCGAFVEDEYFEAEEYHKKFCPNCGAKMDGERREDGT